MAKIAAPVLLDCAGPKTNPVKGPKAPISLSAGGVPQLGRVRCAGVIGAVRGEVDLHLRHLQAREEALRSVRRYGTGRTFPGWRSVAHIPRIEDSGFGRKVSVSLDALHDAGRVAQP